MRYAFPPYGLFFLLVPKLPLGNAIFCRSSCFGNRPFAREAA
jgi:hypothetical protein